MKHIKLIYCPTHKSIKENENTDDLAKTVSKKASHLPQEQIYLYLKLRRLRDRTPWKNRLGDWKIPIFINTNSLCQHYAKNSLRQVSAT